MEISKKHHIPRTTIEHWVKRKKELIGKTDPNAVGFFESAAGLAFLHQTLTAAYLVFHKMAACGLPSLQNFLRLGGLAAFIGSSQGTLHKVSSEIDTYLEQFGKEEKERLGAQMSHREISACGDETFFKDLMIMVLMDAPSGFILAKQEEEKRDALTWEKVCRSVLTGLNAELIQVTGDEAGGLTSCVKNLLGIHKSSDLFHLQQDITKGLTAPITRQVRQAEDALKKNMEEQSACLQRIEAKVEKANASVHDACVAKTCKKMHQILEQKIVCQKALEELKELQTAASNERKKISGVYHPFDLSTGGKRTAEQLKAELTNAYEKLDELSEKAKCSDNYT